LAKQYKKTGRDRTSKKQKSKKIEEPKVDKAPSVPAKVKKIVVTAKTENQKKVLKSIKENKVTLIYGPPGTGKTFLGVSHGMSEVLKGSFKRIIFTRPCVEAAGERLGFLPGDMKEKLDPYMIPIYDSLKKYMTTVEIDDFVKKEVIETLPMAFMRGKTFEDAIVIADEFQNSTPDQAVMILTRLGRGSKLVITGDVDQNDIKGVNGLEDAIKRLQDIKDLSFVEMEACDNQRDPIIMEILDRYASKEDKKG